MVTNISSFFADTGSWTTDIESYYNGLPSKYNIDALEPSWVILFPYDDFEILKQQIFILSTLSQKLITANDRFTQKGLLMNINAAVKENILTLITLFQYFSPNSAA